MDDLYEIWTTVAAIRGAAQLRGYFTPVELTALEDLGHALARIAEDEMRARATVGP